MNKSTREGRGSGYDLVISGGRVIDPETKTDRIADVFIQDGIIKKVEKTRARIKAKEIIDARGKVVVPGLIDMHAHLREPGREDEETIYTGSCAAVAGGFTSICCMPNTQPPIDNQETVKFVYQKAKEARCRIYCIGCITKGQKGEELTEINDLVRAGAVAISDDGKPVSNSQVLRNALEYSSMFDLPVISHCEDLSLSANGVMHEGFVSTNLGMCGIPAVAEETMIARDIALAEFTGARLHIAHVSTEGSVDLIRQAKKRGVRVTCEATPHHFTLTDEIIRTFDTNAKVNPPLRTKRDVDAIRRGLKDGTIDCIATDHAPHSIEEKEVEFDFAPPGLVGLETALGLVITELINKRILSWTQAVAKLTINPARVLNLEGGRVKRNSPADITIIDPKASWVVDPPKFLSKSKNSPFAGRKLRGKVCCTIVNGKVAFEA
ncbi:MAG: dihydroorotase [Candidatus Zixiibacteriota bacterium]|nr:MAG: dihydroorotase [candidate division Zixibacteria bacterium]